MFIRMFYGFVDVFFQTVPSSTSLRCLGHEYSNSVDSSHGDAHTLLPLGSKNDVFDWTGCQHVTIQLSFTNLHIFWCLYSDPILNSNLNDDTGLAWKIVGQDGQSHQKDCYDQKMCSLRLPVVFCDQNPCDQKLPVVSIRKSDSKPLRPSDLDGLSQEEVATTEWRWSWRTNGVIKCDKLVS